LVNWWLSHWLLVSSRCPVLNSSPMAIISVVGFGIVGWLYIFGDRLNYESHRIR